MQNVTKIIIKKNQDIIIKSCSKIQIQIQIQINMLFYSLFCRYFQYYTFYFFILFLFMFDSLLFFIGYLLLVEDRANVGFFVYVADCTREPNQVIWISKKQKAVTTKFYFSLLIQVYFSSILIILITTWALKPSSSAFLLLLPFRIPTLSKHAPDFRLQQIPIIFIQVAQLVLAASSPLGLEDLLVLTVLVYQPILVGLAVLVVQLDLSILEDLAAAQLALEDLVALVHQAALAVVLVVQAILVAMADPAVILAALAVLVDRVDLEGQMDLGDQVDLLAQAGQMVIQ